MAFLNEATWKVVAPHSSLSGLTSRYPLPRVECPIIDTREIPEERGGLVGKIIAEHVFHWGVKERDILIARLVALGAREVYVTPLTPVAKRERENG